MELTELLKEQGQIKEAQGPLADIFYQVDTDGIQSAREITNDRRKIDVNLRKKEYWTADGSMYTIEDGKAILYFTDLKNNLILRNIEEATRQFTKTENYVPSQEDIKSVIDSVESGSTLRIELSDLNLQRLNNEFSYFEIDTSKYDTELKGRTQRRFAGRIYGEIDSFEKMVYGEQNEFDRNMQMFREAEIKKIKIYVLNPDYVKANVTENNKAIARTSKLFAFDSNIFQLTQLFKNTPNLDTSVRAEDIIGRMEKYKKYIPTHLRSVSNYARNTLKAEAIKKEKEIAEKRRLKEKEDKLIEQQKALENKIRALKRGMQNQERIIEQHKMGKFKRKYVGPPTDKYIRPHIIYPNRLFPNTTFGPLTEFGGGKTQIDKWVKNECIR